MPTCQNCHAEIQPPLTKFCSRACSTKYHNSNRDNRPEKTPELEGAALRYANIVAAMVAAGYLPPASCTAPDGQLAWTAEAMAGLFGLSLAEFLSLMGQRGPQYVEDRGVPSMWHMCRVP